MPLAFIDFERVFNFRDVGGLPTRDGHVVRHGILYRSDNLGGLREADRLRFAALGVRTIVDLRQPREIERQGGRAPEWSCDVWHNVPMHNPAWREEDYSPAEGPIPYLIARYHEAAHGAGEHIVQVLTILADPAAGPVALHCLGGRDRTGIVVAFLLDLLGVSDEDIAADYHFTERSTRRFMTWYLTQDPDAELLPYIAVTPAEVILTFLRELRAQYGSVEAYLQLHGLTPEQVAVLRATYRQ